MAIRYYEKCASYETFRVNANFNLGNICFLVKKENAKALEYYKRLVEEPTVQNLYRKMIQREMTINIPWKDSAKYKQLQKIEKHLIQIRKVVVGAIVETIQKVIRSRTQAIGIGVPGVVDRETGTSKLHLIRENK